MIGKSSCAHGVSRLIHAIYDLVLGILLRPFHQTWTIHYLGLLVQPVCIILMDPLVNGPWGGATQRGSSLTKGRIVLCMRLIVHLVAFYGIDKSLRRIISHLRLLSLPPIPLLFQDAFASLWHMIIQIHPANIHIIHLLLKLLFYMIEYLQT